MAVIGENLIQNIGSCYLYIPKTPTLQHPLSAFSLSINYFTLFTFFYNFFSSFYLWVSKVSTYPSGTKNISHYENMDKYT